MEESEVVKSMSALAQPTRLQAFRALVVAGPDGLTPGDLAHHLDVPAPTLSFHLRELVHAGLISQQRDGRNLIYRVEFGRMNDLMSFLTAHCCGGRACAVTKRSKEKC